MPPNGLRFSYGHEPATRERQFFLLGYEGTSPGTGGCPGRPSSCKRGLGRHDSVSDTERDPVDAVVNRAIYHRLFGGFRRLDVKGQ